MRFGAAVCCFLPSVCRLPAPHSIAQKQWWKWSSVVHEEAYGAEQWPTLRLHTGQIHDNTCNAVYHRRLLDDKYIPTLSPVEDIKNISIIRIGIDSFQSTLECKPNRRIVCVFADAALRSPLFHAHSVWQVCGLVCAIANEYVCERVHARHLHQDQHERTREKKWRKYSIYF